LKVEATGLRLVAPAASADESLRAFGGSMADWSVGTSIALLVSCSSGGLIQFDAANSSLAKLTDDKGTDLLAKPAPTSSAPAGPRGAVRSIGFSLFPRISKDGRYCAMEVSSPGLPAKGSTRIHLEGVIAMLCATEKSEHAQKGVPLQKSSKIAAQDLELTILDAGKPDTGDEPWSVTLRAYRDLDAVAEVRFFKADGTEIKSRRTGTSRMGLLGAVTVDWSFNLAEKADTATVKVFVWSNLKKRQAPFSLDVDVGSF
jgi:hypothetical protein